MQVSAVRSYAAAAASAASRPVGCAPRFRPSTTLRPAPRRPRRGSNATRRQRAEHEAAPQASSSPATASDPEPETVFYEGSGSNLELALSIALGATLIFLPLTLASIGRRLWISYRFTNKRVVVTTSSPVLKREVQVKYSQIKEIRSAPRALGAWGDVVIFLKDGSRLPLAGLERYQEIVDYIQGKIE